MPDKTERASFQAINGWGWITRTRSRHIIRMITVKVFDQLEAF